MTLTGINQLWVSDITYIRLRTEFVYLAVILDGFSRKVVGWKLDRTLASRLATEALQQAIAARRPWPGLVHHSDRGVQYASADYIVILRQHGMIPSMSRPANPYDNASCESFFKTLKREEIYATEYADVNHLRDHIEEFIERYYNQKRLHSESRIPRQQFAEAAQVNYAVKQYLAELAEQNPVEEPVHEQDQV
jgi:transposase InsO family protein